MPDDELRRTVRYREWMRRKMHSLGDGAELWADPSEHPDWDEWKALLRVRRPDDDPDLSHLGYNMTRTLIHHLVFAGGGVEAEYLRLEEALTKAQEWTAWAFEVHPAPPPDQERDPNFKMHTNAPSLLDAYYAFGNLLTWTRAVEDRIDRRHVPSNRRNRRNRRVGLAPALVEGSDLRRDVEQALETFRASTSDLRWFANFALHAGFIPGGGSPYAIVDDDARMRVPLPDPPDDPRTPITTWEQFTFTQDRDMFSYAQEAMAAVERVMNAVLTAFEEHRPERFQFWDDK